MMNQELTSTASDYTPLSDLLAAQKWKKADGESAKKILEVMSRTEQGCFCGMVASSVLLHQGLWSIKIM